MIGQPLNRLVTFRPPDIDQMEPVERCRLFERLRNKAGQFARDHKFPFTGVWSRETHPGVVGPATGEHMHLLMHVPRKWKKKFDDVVVNWLPGPTSGHCGHGWTCSLPRPVAIDTRQPSWPSPICATNYVGSISLRGFRINLPAYRQLPG